MRSFAFVVVAALLALSASGRMAHRLRLEGSKHAVHRRATTSGKRGLAYNTDSFTTLFANSSEVTWSYNWGQQSGTGYNDKLEYAPMLWSDASDLTSNWDTSVTRQLAKGSKHLLGFNEPDLCVAGAGSSCMDMNNAVTAWQKYMQPYAGKALLGSPAVTNSGAPGGLTWLQNFMGNCTGCTFDFINIHWYSNKYAGLTYLQWQVEQARKVANGRPIWITEFGLTDDYTEAELESFLSSSMEWLDAQPDVARYAYFWAGQGSSNWMIDSSGTGLTPIGRLFAGSTNSTAATTLASSTQATSTVASSAKPIATVATTSSTKASSTASSTKASSTASSTKASSTASSTKASSAASSTKVSSTPSSTKVSSTPASTTKATSTSPKASSTSSKTTASVSSKATSAVSPTKQTTVSTSTLLTTSSSSSSKPTTTTAKTTAKTTTSSKSLATSATTKTSSTAVVAAAATSSTSSLELLSAYYVNTDVTSRARSAYVSAGKLAVNVANPQKTFGLSSNPWPGKTQMLSMMYSLNGVKRMVTFTKGATACTITAKQACGSQEVLTTPPVAKPAGSPYTIVAIVWGGRRITNTGAWTNLWQQAVSQAWFQLQPATFGGSNPLKGQSKSAIIWYTDSSGTLKAISGKQAQWIRFPPDK
ncbi:unnamed protein product [Jaminaea pallidilutea]